VYVSAHYHTGFCLVVHKMWKFFTLALPAAKPARCQPVKRAASRPCFARVRVVQLHPDGQRHRNGEFQLSDLEVDWKMQGRNFCRTM